MIISKNSPLSILENRGEVMVIGWHIIYQCWLQPRKNMEVFGICYLIFFFQNIKDIILPLDELHGFSVNAPSAS